MSLRSNKGTHQNTTSIDEKIVTDSKPKNGSRSLLQEIDAFVRFTRPHTIIGTTLSISSVSLFAVEKYSDISPVFFIGVIQAIAAFIMMNIYVVGFNQLTDIEIDKVNKPYLPLASGEYSVATGVMLVISTAIMSFGIGWAAGSEPLFWGLVISFVLGTAYSIDLPLLRWKRFAVLAATCTLGVRAVVIQIAIYLHIQMSVYGRPAVLIKPVIFVTTFMTFFSIVIALFKDIPDIVGDKKHGIDTFSVRMGQKRVFWICISLLEIAYSLAVLVGATSSTMIGVKLVTVVGHILLGSLLLNRAKSIDLKSNVAITSFYMFIWKLFYAEYLLIPLLR